MFIYVQWLPYWRIEGGTVSHAPSLARMRFFSLAPWLLLDLTELNWGVTGDSEKIQDRQEEIWGQVCCTLDWKHTTLIASFLCLDSLRPYSFVVL
jgi:hypothetical protein